MSVSPHQSDLMPPLLLIVDVQKSSVVSSTAHVPAAVQSLQDHYGKVVATCLLDGSEEGWIGEPPLAFVPRRDAIVTGKLITSAVTPHVREIIEREGVKRVDICGVDTDQAVFATAAALSDMGLRVRVISTACGSTAGEEHHQWGLRFLQRLLGKDALIGFDAIRQVA